MRNRSRLPLGARSAGPFAEVRSASWLLALAALLVVGSPATGHAQGVTAALQPTTQQVVPGTDFDLTLQVTQAGSPFNGLDAVIGYDPAALTLVSLTDAEQEGDLLTSACGDLFHRFITSAASVKASEVMLCSNTFVTGPGAVYRLRFHASATPQVTLVRWLAGTHFYSAGLYVTPLSTTDAVVHIGTTTAVGPGALGAGTSVRALPNPAFATTTFEVRAGRGPQEITITDVQGRLVRQLERGDFAAGLRRVAWDGRSDSGARVATGVYLVTLREGTSRTQARVLLLQ